MGIAERAKKKFQEVDAKEQQENMDELLNNPLSQLYAAKHPEEMKDYSERHYD